MEDEYLSPEALILSNSEIKLLEQSSKKLYSIFREELDRIISTSDFKAFDLPTKMLDLIHFSYENSHDHVLGRFDFSGGINGLPLKMLEFNADTPTMLPEILSAQPLFERFLPNKNEVFNKVAWQLEVVFNRLGIGTAVDDMQLLGTSLGHEDDRANVQAVLDIAGREQFVTYYSDLENIHFAPDDGVFIEDENGEFHSFKYLYKGVPWEFICFEEPELLDILHSLIMPSKLTVFNPPYALLWQSKALLVSLYEKYENDFLLETSFNQNDFKGRPFVEKVEFGRLGENIKILDAQGSIKDSTNGDYAHFKKIYQEFALLYQDEHDEYYQLSVYNSLGVPSGVGVRRGERLIIDEDAQFIPHTITPLN